MAEIDDAALAQLQKSYQLLQTLASNPKAKADFERAVKAVNPEVQTEADVAERIAAPYVDQFNKLQEKIDARFKAEDERRAKDAEDRQEADIALQFNRLQERGYTDEGLGKIKDLMLTRRIADPEAAALLFDSQNPKPATTGAHSWEPDYLTNDANSLQGGINIKELMNDPEKWADREVGNVLFEMRKAG